MKLEFFNRFSKHSEILNFMKIFSVGADLWQTDMIKLAFTFRSFAKVLKNSYLVKHIKYIE